MGETGKASRADTIGRAAGAGSTHASGTGNGTDPIDVLDAFLERHMGRLERHLERFAPDYRVTPDFLDYVEQVLDDWDGVPLEARYADYRPGEKVFWFTLYQLEELAEVPSSWDQDPYVAIMRSHLPELGQRLARRAPLPSCFGACRPGGLDLSADAPDLDGPGALDFDDEEPPPD